MSSTIEAPILEGVDLEKTYEMGDRGLRVLRGVSIEVRAREILAIQGPSGAGKSTLLHLLGLLDEPDRGEVRYRGKDLLLSSPGERARFRNETVGFVFQFYHLFPDLTALENVCLPKMVELSWLDYPARKVEIRARARELLSLVGLGHRMEHLPSELSGGERQRVAIARALMNGPEVLLCDEPTGNLDQKTAGEILDLLWKLNAEKGQTFVIVTHDEALARRAHRVVRMVDGVISQDGAPPRPRGFEDTRFKLRGRPPRGGYRLNPLLAFLLALVPPLWLYLVHSRFRRATGRGHSGLGAALGTLLPVFNLFWLAWVNVKPLREAHRLLQVNGLSGLRWRYLPLLFAWTLVLFPLAAAWIQSLHNTFYDRMQAEACRTSG